MWGTREENREETNIVCFLFYEASWLKIFSMKAGRRPFLGITRKHWEAGTREVHEEWEWKKYKIYKNIIYWNLLLYANWNFNKYTWLFPIWKPQLLLLFYETRFLCATLAVLDWYCMVLNSEIHLPLLLEYWD